MSFVELYCKLCDVPVEAEPRPKNTLYRCPQCGHGFIRSSCVAKEFDNPTDIIADENVAYLGED